MAFERVCALSDVPELQDRLMGVIETRLGALPGLDEQPVEA